MEGTLGKLYTTRNEKKRKEFEILVLKKYKDGLSEEGSVILEEIKKR